MTVLCVLYFTLILIMCKQKELIEQSVQLESGVEVGGQNLTL